MADILSQEEIDTLMDWNNDLTDNDIYDSIEYSNTCDNCKFWKDARKCPMTDYANMHPKNYCYNFYSKDNK